MSTALRPDLLPSNEELAVLRRVAIGQAPADPARPFVLLVRPRPGTASTACAPLPLTDPHE